MPASDVWSGRQTPNSDVQEASIYRPDGFSGSHTHRRPPQSPSPPLVSGTDVEMPPVWFKV